MSSVSKVVFGNTTVMDITDSTVDSDTLLTGTKAYGANGDPVIGGVVKSWTGTAAQYAQEASQIPDGTQVNILDDFTPVGMPIGIADIYSTEEREIGVWTDGKPLYQKTIDFGTLPNNNNKSVAHNISNIDLITNISIIGYYANDTKYGFPIPQAHNSDLSRGIFADTRNDSCFISTKVDYSSAKAYFTLQYTKTTDQPGSGKYVPSGAPAVHYSTDEQIIGTWIDGKPIYQKTINGTIPTPSEDFGSLVNQYIDVSALNIDTFLGSFNVAKSSTLSIAFDGEWSTRKSDGTVGILASFHDPVNTRITVINNRLAYGGLTINITIQYTKATD